MNLMEERQEQEVIKQNMEREQQAENCEQVAEDKENETSKKGQK